MTSVAALPLLLLLGAALVPPASGAFFRQKTQGRQAGEQSPVARVVQLVSQLKDEVAADGKLDQQSYDKYACWCEDTLARKARDVDNAKELIEELNVRIPKTGAEVASHGAEVAQLEKDIAANEAGQKEATEVRNNENAAYAGDKAEAENCMGALEAAVKGLTGAGVAKKAFLDTMHQAQLISVAADVKSILSKDSAAQRTSDQNLEALRRFVDKPTEFLQAPVSAVQVGSSAGNNPFGDYAPQSTQIQGILKGMYDSFASDLEKGNAEEADKQKAYEELMDTKREEHTTLTKTHGKHSDDRAQKAEQLAQDNTERDDTTAQLEADEDYFATVKAGCQQKAEDWSKRSSLRFEELRGIDKALQILSDPKNVEVFNSAATTLVQISSVKSKGSTRGRAAALVSKAYSRIQDLAAQYQSLSLGRLAVQVKTGGHFDKVMGSIDHMIAELREEEQSDIEHRDRCQNSEGKNKNDLEDVKHQTGQAEAEIRRLGGNIQELKKQIQALRGDMDNADKEMQDLLNLRNEEHADFQQALKDDDMAITIIRSASTAMAKFYKRNRLDTPGLLQKSKKGEPEYTIDKDKAPETSWDTADYGGRNSETSGIMAILEMIVEDLEKEIKIARQEEDQAQSQYEEERSKLRKVHDTLKKKKVEAEMKAAELGEKKDDQEELKLQLGEELQDQQGLQQTLVHDCSWVKTHFESRREKRKTETQGLQQAKAILSGVDSGDYDEIALISATAGQQH